MTNDSDPEPDPRHHIPHIKVPDPADMPTIQSFEPATGALETTTETTTGTYTTGGPEDKHPAVRDLSDQTARMPHIETPDISTMFDHRVRQREEQIEQAREALKEELSGTLAELVETARGAKTNDFISDIDSHDDMERHNIRRVTLINEDTDETVRLTDGGMEIYIAADKYELRIPLDKMDYDSTTNAAGEWDGYDVVATTEDNIEHYHAVVSSTHPLTGTTLAVRWYDDDTVDPRPSIRFGP